MSILAIPIYTGTLNGKPLRFFHAPFQEPHLPWHSWEDLLDCLCANISSQANYDIDKADALRFMRRDYPGDILSLAVPSGIISITPHYIAKCFIIHLSPSEEIRRRNFYDYKLSLSNAWRSSTILMSERDSENLLTRAVSNTDLAEAGGHAA